MTDPFFLASALQVEALDEVRERLADFLRAVFLFPVTRLQAVHLLVQSLQIAPVPVVGLHADLIRFSRDLR